MLTYGVENGAVASDAAEHDAREEEDEERVHVSQRVLQERLGQVHALVRVILRMPQQQLDVVLQQERNIQGRCVPFQCNALLRGLWNHVGVVASSCGVTAVV